MNWHRQWKRRTRIKRLFPTINLNFFKLSLWVKLSRFLFVGVIGLSVFSFVAFAWVARELPDPTKVVRSEGFATKILDRGGKSLYDVFEKERRTPIELSGVPQYLKDATVAIEDKNFYRHKGFDPMGWLRAVYNIVVRRRLAGGSTLTQQLVKNVLLSPQRTIWRKIKEFILSVQIERKFSKDEILQMYLNEAPYGGTVWGVEAAAEMYFDKKVTELNLVESAVLAGLPQRPSYYSPFLGERDAFKGRTKDVLRRMREDDFISRDQEAEALKELNEIKFSSDAGKLKAAHFVFYVRRILEQTYGEKLVESGGLVVTTTLDLDLQDKAQEIVAEEIKKVEAVKITNGAAVVMDVNTGEILAMVGSKGYDTPNYDGKVNVTTSLRQPGSTIKPVTYVTAFKKGYTPSTMLMDVPTEFPGGEGKETYKPVNYDGKYRGPVQLRYALGNSLNVPSVKLLARVGVKDVLATAYDMGLSTLEPNNENIRRLGLSLTLGGGEVRLLELTSAYSAFANGGLKVEPVAILKVVDNKGKVLDEFRPAGGKRVLSSQHVYLINNILSDNKAREAVFGPRSLINIPGGNIAVKTGTTNDRRDNWTIGWGYKTKVVGVWVGNNDNSAMKEVSSGTTGAAPIWRKILMTAMGNNLDRPFEVPEGMVTVDVDEVSGFRAHDGFSSRSEYFVSGTEPTEIDSVHKKLKLCKSSKKLATPVDISRGDFEEREFFAFFEDDPTGGENGVNLWQKGIDEWVQKQTDERYHPPKDYCDSVDEISVEFIEPIDRATLTANDVMIKVKAITAASVSKLEIFVDGTSRANFTGPPYEVTVFLSDGVHSIKAVMEDARGKKSEREIRIGVNSPWEVTPTASPSPTPQP